MNLPRLLLALLAGVGAAAPLVAAPTVITSKAGATVELDAAAGRYQVRLASPAWTLAGELGAPATDAAVGPGTDGIGPYREIRFNWAGRSAGIRVYDARPAVLFTLTDEGATSAPPTWPRFTAFPAGLHHFSYRDDVFAPPAFALEKNGTPWLLFDEQADSVILSPADNFMTARMVGDGVHEIACGLNPGATGLPPHFTRRALLAFGSGINATWDAWGAALTDLAGKIRPANDADLRLRSLAHLPAAGTVGDEQKWLPLFYLQASAYGNVTTARASRNRFQRSVWDPFLYTSRLATSVGVWPSTDVFMSTETDNALLSILSAGMYGIGDPIGGEAAVNLSRAARTDGVLVKPDAPLLPADAMYLAEANGYKPPMVAWTRTDHAAQRTAYLYLYTRGTEAEDASFTPAALGFAGDVMVLNRGTGAAWREPADELFVAPIEPGGFGYFQIAPVGPGGLVFFGDQGKFVSNGRKRIAALTARARGVTATVTFAAGEKSVALFGFSRGAPSVKAERGRVGEIGYNTANGRYTFDVFPSDEISGETPGGEKIRQAVVAVDSPPAKARTPKGSR